ncbi:MAG: hypothetical protein BWK76_17305 [Desulfobulbaceae bacterium A2]|nr:MAG: hypothetical protein BWK76_17305 [Desulfobulbaceae bacterium A2]
MNSPAPIPGRNVFRRLLASMVAFGLMIGIFFPFIEHALFQGSHGLSWSFFLLCMAAGCAVGLVNYLLFHLVISRELSSMIQGMQCINARVNQALRSGDPSPFQCVINVSTEDQLGEAARAFNTMGDAIEELFQEEQRLRRIMATLANETDPVAVARHIVENLPHHLAGELVLLYLRQRQDFVLQAATGDRLAAPESIEVDPARLQAMLESGRSCRHSGVTSDALLLIPLRYDRAVIALLAVAAPTPSSPDERLRGWETYAGLVTPYLHNALLHQQLQEQASIDPLTRAFNRRFGMRRLQEEFHKAQRHQGQLSLIMLDLDHFKRINDLHGHQAGDMVLSVMTMAITDNLRQEDIFCRYGGEEFLVLLPGSNLAAATRGAERLRRLVGRLELPLAQETQLTLSLGVATWPLISTSDPQELLRAADQALYHAKHIGRNRVAVHDGQEVRGARPEEMEKYEG